MKVGFLLGSFDPIHIGHLYMASSVLNADLVDEVVFVPSVQNPWKENSTDFLNRCYMIYLAIDNMEHCFLSNIDYKNTKPYYSANTLKLLKEEYPNDDLYIIVGVDIVNDIKNWHEGQWILDNFKLITIAREGYLDAGIHDISKTINISSTEIRELVKANKQIYPLVPKVVSQYIKKFNLYK